MKNEPSMLGNMSGTARFALVVAVGVGLVITIIVSTREKVSAQPAASTAGTAAPAEVPETITGEWCGRLRSRLESRLNAEGRAKYPDRDVAKGVRDHVANVEHDCTQAAGAPMSEHWRCRWDETFDGEERCKELRKSESKAATEKAKADEAEREAQAKAKATAAARLQAQAKIERTGEDDKCVSDGKPRRGLAITGGTYDANEAVATSMGCVRSHVYYPQQGHSAIDNYYCCP